MELSGDEKGRKCRLGVLYGTLGRQKWARMPLQEPAIREKYVRLLIKQFGGLSEELVYGFFVALWFCLTG